MFKHTQPPESNPPASLSAGETGGSNGANSVIPPRNSTPAALRELLEKNLKWSQIIYEQNRRINRKMWWSAAASWIQLLVIVVPLVLSLIFLPTFIKQYRCLWQGGCTNQQLPPGIRDEIIKLLPLSQAERDRLKTITR